MYSTSAKILQSDKIDNTVAVWKFKGLKIVFTNGCFDILHPGHVEYLEKAKACGDVMIIGLNSDESVSRIKGSNRPFMAQDARARILSGLEFVDAVIMFSEDTPQKLIEQIKPHVLVKGADYKEDEIAGADFVKKNGGEVKLIELVEGWSTTSIAEKIRNSQS